MSKFLLLILPFMAKAQIRDYSKLVNPLVGTAAHGHTYPGATSPFGMVQLSPDTRMADWDGSSGYHYSDSLIYGFSHTHLSGTGVPDYCDILLQPTTGNYQWNNYEYASAYSHNNEKAYAGYYNVYLDKYNVDVALTTTAHTGLHQYTFAKNTREGNVLLDLIHRDIVLDSYIQIVDEYTVQGYRYSNSWASKQKLFFYLKFNSKIKRKAIHLTDTTSQLLSTTSAKGKAIQAAFTFDVSNGVPLQVQVAISGVSMAGAKLNYEKENAQFNFKKTVATNVKNWNTQLQKIEITSHQFNNIDTIFYTALYHTMVVPNLYQDVDGQYRGTDDKIHKANGFTNYTVFSLWDTYRAYHPLMSIINPAITNDWVNTFVHQYTNGGMLPVWELSANETYCMIAYHSVPVILDAYKKGITKFDANLALEAMLAYSCSAKFGISDYAKTGYLSNDVEAESVSKTLEYAYDDWCIAEFAKLLGKQSIAKEYYKRSLNFINLYNPATAFFQGKNNASWLQPFTPTEVNNYYTEGNAWHYRFAVPHQIPTLIKLMGGAQMYEQYLTEIFTTNQTLTGREQADVTGLIGQYAHGNEPSHHIAYLYAFANMANNKTPYYVNKICNEFYKNTHDGLIGNEDCGQMSAWYIWSVLGMYPTNPASNEFTVGSPQIKQAIIHIANGKKIIINVSKPNANCYFPTYASTQFITNNSINYASLKNGATINYTMVPEPIATKVTEVTEYKKDVIDTNFVATPYLTSTQYKFRDSTTIHIASIDSTATIRYCIAQKEDPNTKQNNEINTTTLFKNNATNTAPINNELVNVIKGTTNYYANYTQPITISNSCVLYMYTIKNNKLSGLSVQPFYKIKNDKTITVLSKVAPMYTAGGNDALIDGIVGTTNWRAGNWQSSYGNSFEANIDLLKSKKVTTITTTFLQDIKSWIWLPPTMEIYSSNDAVNYTLVATVTNTIDEKSEVAQIENFEKKFANVQTRYIKIKATNFGTIPNWHIGVGNPSHLFISEINIETE